MLLIQVRFKKMWFNSDFLTLVSINVASAFSVNAKTMIVIKTEVFTSCSMTQQLNVLWNLFKCLFNSMQAPHRNKTQTGNTKSRSAHSCGKWYGHLVSGNVSENMEEISVNKSGNVGVLTTQGGASVVIRTQFLQNFES